MPDPLKYFRIEAREIVEQLQAALLALERGEAPAATMARLLRLAHTLKGAARVVKQGDIATLSHAVEDLLVPHRDATEPPARDVIDRLLSMVDEISAHVGRLAPAPEVPVAPANAPAGSPDLPASASSAATPFETTGAGTGLGQIDNLMDGVAELGFQLASLRHGVSVLTECRNLAEQLVARLDPQRSSDWSRQGAPLARALGNQLEGRLAELERDLGGHLERATRELGQVRDRVDQLRLVAAGSMFGALERAARDSAVSLGKRAHFEASGGEIRLDADVLSAVQRALVQAVRNAVAHGIEPVEERTARGKPAQGRIKLRVLRRGRQICFLCDDDGKGVDLAEVRRQAQELGRLTSVDADADQLLLLLLRGGITTSSVVSEVSGRGVGMDLIRESLAGVGGSVSLRTSAGAGTCVELTVPATLSALDALLVDVGGEVAALPLSAVVRAARFEVGQLNRTADATSINVDGEVVPFFPLSSLLRMPEREESRRRAWTTVVIRGKRGLLGLGVDQLLGAEGIVARGLPESAELDGTIAAVTLDADGNPRPLLDPDGLLAAASHTPLRAAHGAPRKRAVLVIDDSLTTRMLEQSILESAGYEVALATSAEQGLEMAQAREYDLFLVDVEMPGMDGFAFVERTRADPKLAKTPAVLVTSRASAEDLARGKAAGASGHIAKGEFDQVDFLERIDRLMR